MRTLLIAFVLAAACLGVTPAVAADAAAAPAKNRVVLQVSDGDPGKWNLALNNARNVQSDLGAGNVELEIVAYGPGIGMLKMDSPVASRIDEALAAGVKVVACENTMTGQKLTKADMLPRIGYVPAGVTEIMRKQQEGYAYIRP
jgi:intracellular sulfur oxidation DsrE/DsrF family protein